MYEFDRRVKYNFNYLKKNIDIEKFLKLLPKNKWNFNKEIDILSGAIFPSCINKNNKDPNLIQKRLFFEKSIKEEILNELFSDSDFDQKLFEHGTFFQKLNPNFKLIKHIKLGDQSPIFMPEEIVDQDTELYKLKSKLDGNFPPFWISPFLQDLVDGTSVCSHSLIEIKNENSNVYMHTVYFDQEGYDYQYDPYLINVFNDKLNDQSFLEEIINFEQKRVDTDRKSFKDYLKAYNGEEKLTNIYRIDLKTKKPIYNFSKSGKFINISKQNDDFIKEWS